VTEPAGELGVTLELAEGFDGDAVVVLLDGLEVWRGADVRTNWSVGLAQVVHLSARQLPAVLEVRVGGDSRTADLPESGLRLRAARAPDGRLQVNRAPAGPIF
jgi:hypothetical protein